MNQIEIIKPYQTHFLGSLKSFWLYIILTFQRSFRVCWTKRLSLVIPQCIKPLFQSSVQLAPSYSNQAEKIKPLVTNLRFSHAPSTQATLLSGAVFAWKLHLEVSNLSWIVLWETILHIWHESCIYFLKVWITCVP